MAYFVGNVLVDEDDGHVWALGELLEGILHLTDGRVLFHYEEVAGTTTPLSHSSKQEAGHCILITNSTNEFAVIHACVFSDCCFSNPN
eukprot:CAMPEP_0113934826 /NCGR_PEP_ID=MMETSP1339-20121228/2091_1 /TAXON_ID=94617 /ORGANISM="Fibrocapsa japonica" /LENGTH=87 /DNA_ID=CAMNT_0000936767 /DNA_START=387 /DNA_END=650 /DNA_ORIENTATION=+ /assembly_acc=CAM_ASM_000762